MMILQYKFFANQATACRYVGAKNLGFRRWNLELKLSGIFKNWVCIGFVLNNSS